MVAMDGRTEVGALVCCLLPPSIWLELHISREIHALEMMLWRQRHLVRIVALVSSRIVYRKDSVSTNRITHFLLLQRDALRI